MNRTMSNKADKSMEETESTYFMNQGLQCSKCQVEFNEETNFPVLLSCLHTACAPCLEKEIKDTSVYCPKCRVTIPLSSGSVDELPVDYTCLDLVRYKNKDSDLICANCDNTSEVEFRCQDCESFLCDTCKQNHTKIRKMRSHIIIPISEIKDASDLKQEMLCKIPGHKNRPIDVYCDSDSCKVAICSMCWMDNHEDKNDHKRIDITRAFENERDTLLKKADKLNANYEELKSTEKSIAAGMNTVNKRTIDTEFDIVSFYDDCIRILEKRKQYMLKQLNTMSEAQLEDLQNKKAELTGDKNKISQATKFLEQACVSRNPAAFLGIASTINDHFQKLGDTKTTPGLHNESTIVFLTEKERAKIYEDLKNFGAVVAFERQISIPDKVYKNKCSCIEIFLKASPEKRLSFCVQVILQDSSTGRKASIVTEEAEDNLYKANCIIKHVGNYNVEVLVNGAVIEEQSVECVASENETEKVDSTEDLIPDEHDDSTFCNGIDYIDPTDECGSSDAYLEENGDDTVAYLIGAPDPYFQLFDMDDNEYSSDDIPSNPKQEYTLPGPLVIQEQDANKIKFLLGSIISQGVLDKRLLRLHAKVDWSIVQSSGDSFHIECLLAPGMNNLKRKARFWNQIVKNEINKFMETLTVSSEKVKPEEWQFMQERVQEIEVKNAQRVSIYEDADNFFIVIVGYKVPYTEIKKKVVHLTEDIDVLEKMEDYQIHLLKEGKVLDALNQQFKVISIIPKGDHQAVEFCGTAAVVEAARQKISEVLHKVSEVPIKGFSGEKLKLLQSDDVKSVLESFLIDNGQVGAWRVKSDNTIVMCALSESTAKNAATLVEESVVEVDVDPHPDKEMWNQEMEDVKKKKKGQVKIKTTDDNKIVIFAIPKTNVKAIEEHVKIFHKYPNKEVRGTTHFCTKTGQTISTVVGDITDLDNDVIVCSSNEFLNLSVGVGATLIQKGGAEIQKECQDFLAKKPSKKLEEGEVVFTSAGKLKGKMVAHIGGKQWSNDKEKEKASLLNVVQKALLQTSELGHASFAIAAVYTGHSGFPVKYVTEWIVEAVDKYLKNHGKQTILRNIYLCDKVKDAVDAFECSLGKYFDLAYKRE